MSYDFDKLINRKGTYSTQWDYIEDRFGKGNLLPFSISDTDFEVPNVVIEDLRIRLEHKIFGYTRWNHNDFKSAITTYYTQRHQTYINKEWIVYSPSVMYTISKLICTLSNTLDHVLVFDPMYDAFINVIEKNERLLLPCALNKDDSFSINWKDFEDKVKKCKIFLLCSPHNPTGRVFSKEELNRIIILCKQYNVFIISDEIHSDIVLYGNKHIPLLSFYEQYEQLVIVSSASKTFNIPALGGSYAIIVNQEIYDNFMKCSRQQDFVNSANIMGMTAMMSAYCKASDYIDELVFYIEKNMNIVKEFFEKEFPIIQFNVPQATYLAWIDMRAIQKTSQEIQSALIEIGGVAIMAGEVYGENGKQYLRMNVGCSRIKLLEGLQRFKIAMQSLCGEKIC